MGVGVRGSVRLSDGDGVGAYVGFGVGLSHGTGLGRPVGRLVGLFDVLDVGT